MKPGKRGIHDLRGLGGWALGFKEDHAEVSPFHPGMRAHPRALSQRRAFGDRFTDDS
jgi:hypothetical protein